MLRTLFISCLFIGFLPTFASAEYRSNRGFDRAVHTQMLRDEYNARLQMERDERNARLQMERDEYNARLQMERDIANTRLQYERDVRGSYSYRDCDRPVYVERCYPRPSVNVGIGISNRGSAVAIGIQDRGISLGGIFNFGGGNRNRGHDYRHRR
jgi:hypothetical protein